MNRYPYIRKEYPNTHIAYLAGIIDGEGSIYIGAYSSNPKTKTPHYQTNIEVTNTDKNLIDWLSQTFGGRTAFYTAKQTPKNSRRAVYRWMASGERVTHLCELILPYLIVKKRQCEIMLQMRETFKHTGIKKGQQSLPIVSQEILEIRRKLLFEIQNLHIRNYHNKHLPRVTID